MKHIAVLGSTGSIGKNALKAAQHLGNLGQEIAVQGLAARRNIDLLEEQAKTFHPELIAVYEEDCARKLQSRLPHIEVVAGMEGLNAVASLTSADLVISAISGTIGLEPTATALSAGKDVGLANKEALVSGGELVMNLARENEATLIPLDSEHSAIFQCLKGGTKEEVRRIILTASGGPFRNYTEEQLKHITVEDALGHPTWSMGPKNTIDSSTLMNKGLEMIEARWLFDIKSQEIDVVVHPQSIIHSLVEFIDLSMIAQMSEPDMIVPIQYALTYPDRKQGCLSPFDFFKNASLDFVIPDMRKFPCLRLAYEAIHVGGSLPCYMNAANEVLVNRFLDKEIAWTDIAAKLEGLMAKHSVTTPATLECILEIDSLARQEAQSI